MQKINNYRRAITILLVAVMVTAILPTMNGAVHAVQIGAAPNLASASNWAHAAINQAYELGLIPTALQGRYNQPATRAEFSALAVAVYEVVTGREIAERMEFTDTTDINVQKMGGLGIVTGVGGGRFNPNGTIERQQAALMLARLAAAMGYPLPQAAPTFADTASFSSWAVDAVGQVQAADVMGGVGNNNFGPHGQFTLEQSIVTMLRVFAVTDAGAELVNVVEEQPPATAAFDTQILVDFLSQHETLFNEAEMERLIEDGQLVYSHFQLFDFFGNGIPQIVITLSEMFAVPFYNLYVFVDGGFQLLLPPSPQNIPWHSVFADNNGDVVFYSDLYGYFRIAQNGQQPQLVPIVEVRNRGGSRIIDGTTVWDPDAYILNHITGERTEYDGGSSWREHSRAYPRTIYGMPNEVLLRSWEWLWTDSPTPSQLIELEAEVRATARARLGLE